MFSDVSGDITSVFENHFIWSVYDLETAKYPCTLELCNGTS